MDEFNQLYAIKEEIDESIKTHKLFLLSTSDALNVVFTKLGVFYRMVLYAPQENINTYLRKKTNSTANSIPFLDFIQESLKWICRWISRYCKEQSNYKIELYAEAIYDLMGMAYSYELFYRMWFLHSKHIVKYNLANNRIRFSYCNDETYKVHFAYNDYIKSYEENKEYRKILDSHLHDNNRKAFDEAIHKFDFRLGANFSFGTFNLADYEIFSTILNNYIMTKLQGNIILPGYEGISKFSKRYWIQLIQSSCDLDENKIEQILDFFTYNFKDKNADVSLTYFLPLKEDVLLLSESIFLIQRPAINALRMLAKKQSRLYENEQNRFEDTQRKNIINCINNTFLVAQQSTRAQQIRPGMDVLVYDREKRHLQVIELKYKLPVESVGDSINLDNMLNKAYKQILQAKKIVEEHKSVILEEYFGEQFKGITPFIIDYFVITNYSVGMGNNCHIPSPILLESDYLEMMRSRDGMRMVHSALHDKGKGLIRFASSHYVEFPLHKYKIVISEYFYAIKERNKSKW